MLKVVAIASLLVLAAPAAGAAGEGWVRPVPGAVAAPYTFDGVRFAAGRRRGVDFVAQAGEPVLSPCSGVVTFIGRLPRFGPAVSVRCGRLTATVLGLQVAGVKRGSSLASGARLGRAGPGGHIRLGARVTARPDGYANPLALIGAGPHTAPRRRPIVAPLRGPIGDPASPVRAVPSAPHRPRPRVPSRAMTSAPALAWLGLGLMAIGAGGSTVIRGNRRRSRAVGAAGASTDVA